MFKMKGARKTWRSSIRVSLPWLVVALLLGLLAVEHSYLARYQAEDHTNLADSEDHDHVTKSYKITEVHTTVTQQIATSKQLKLPLTSTNENVSQPYKLDPKLHRFVMMTYAKEEAKTYEQHMASIPEKVKKGENTIAHLEGEHGGEWDWCVHVGFHGLLFDWGFSRFISFHLKPVSTLEFGCGIGMYVDYLTRYNEANMTVAIGIEPNVMSAAGIFGRKHPRAKIPPIGLAMNVIEQEDDVLQALGKFDVVYTLEVMEHIPAEHHDKITTFLVERTSKFLLFSAAQPGQRGRGHIPESSRTPEEWIAIFQRKGMYYLPLMSEKLKKAAYAIWSHRENIFMMGTRPDLDDDTPVGKRVHWNRRQVAHKVLFPILQNGSELVARTQNCDDFPINTASEPYDMRQVMY